MTVLVTGCAGFIGYHVAGQLLTEGEHVVGVDNVNDYYDPSLKRARLELLSEHSAFEFVRLNIADRVEFDALFRERRPARVVHLAAQAGVRHSIERPHLYVESNVVAFLNVLEACRHHGVEHLVYASSSSVYGATDHTRSSLDDDVDRPTSLYGATKRSNELMAYSYGHLYGIPTTGLRLFTVYGPWGRPDMSYFIFTSAILEGRPLEVFGHGLPERDFTYIDDVVDGIGRILSREAPAVDGSLAVPWRVYNLGSDRPISVLRLIEVLESKLGRSAELEMRPLPPGDVQSTHADIDDLTRLGWAPQVAIEEGIERFTDWYKQYYAVR